MFLIKGPRYLPEKYNELFLSCIDRLYEKESPDDLIKFISKELSLGALFFLESTNNQIKVTYCSLPEFIGRTGKSTFLNDHIDNVNSFKESDTKKVLNGILETDDIEDLIYRKNIKICSGLINSSCCFLACSSEELDRNQQEFLEIILPHFRYFEHKIKRQREKNDSIEKENRMLDSLLSFINFAGTKTSFEEIADFAVNQIYLEMDFPAVFIVLKEKESWRPVALNASLKTEKALQILSHKLEDIRLANIQVDQNKLIKHITEKVEPFTSHALSDGICPPLEQSAVEKVQSLLQVETVYAVPIDIEGNVIGTIVYLSKNKEIKAYEERVLKSYAHQLSIVLAEARENLTIRNAKDTIDSAYKNLEEINKAKDNLISMASHELRTPATVARNAVALLFEYKKDMDPFVIDKLGMIKEAADREISIINTMLEASRINMKKMELFYQQIDLEHIIEVACSELGLEAAKKGIALEYLRNDTPLPQITADATRIREVIDNLITNAIKYTDEGSITVRTSLKDNLVEVSITDTGKGISEEMQKTLFQMFHRVTDTALPYDKQQSHQGGLGLGLFIIKNIIDAHEGTIEVKSEIGKGSTFTFYLPIKHG